MGLAQKRDIEVIKEEMIDETMRLHVFPVGLNKESVKNWIALWVMPVFCSQR